MFTAFIDQFMDYFWCNTLLKVWKIPRRNNFSSGYLSFFPSIFSYYSLSLALFDCLHGSGKKPGWCYVSHDTETKGRTKSICSREVVAVLTEPVRKHCVIPFKSVTPVNHPTTSGMSSAVERTCSLWLRSRKLRHQLWFLHRENPQ